MKLRELDFYDILNKVPSDNYILKSLIENYSSSIINEYGKIIDYNIQFLRLFDYENEGLKNRFHKMLVSKKNDFCIFDTLEDILYTQKAFSNTLLFTNRIHEDILLHFTIFPIYDEEKFLYFIVIYFDQTVQLELENEKYILKDRLFRCENDLHEALEEIKESETYMHKVLNTHEQFVIAIEDNKLIEANDTFLEFNGAEDINDFNIKYKSIGSLFSSNYNIHSNFISEWMDYNTTIWYDYVLENKNKHNKVLIQKDGMEFIFSVSVNNIVYRKKPIVSVVFTNITEIEKAQETIKKLAYYDSLTNLPNRVLFKDRLDYAIAESKRKKDKVAVLYLDLDRFKLVNDTLGHSIGDSLLIQVSKILSSQLRIIDTISRVGGDEFVIILPSISDSNNALLVAKKIIDAMQKVFIVEQHHIYTTTSIGIAIYPEHGNCADILVKNADTAMYQAKEKGRNNWQFFESYMSLNVNKQMKLEHDLREALINKNELRTFFQPKISLKDDKIMGAEVLIRWEHPKLGLLFPDSFVQMAESTGLIFGIGDFVIEESIKMIHKWSQMGKNVQLAINISARQFQDTSLINYIEKTLKKYNVDPKLLECEITESISMSNIKSGMRILKDMKSLGIRIAMDDFGTGYSSLSYLKQFPLDILKIDRAFVDGMVNNEDDKAIVQMIISMGQTLGIEIVAEGVETQEHVHILKSMGCQYAQGYFYSKPITQKKFEKMLF